MLDQWPSEPTQRIRSAGVDIARDPDKFMGLRDICSVHRLTAADHMGFQGWRAGRGAQTGGFVPLPRSNAGQLDVERK